MEQASTQEMPLACSRILVTGGTGFFGRSLVSQLEATGHSVRIMSRSRVPTALAGTSMYKGDITCLKDVRSAMQGCEAVFHCAAEKADEEKMTAANVEATRLLFDVAGESGVKLFCYLSSVGVIGRARAKVVDEDTPCNPMNRYEETKLAAEQIVNGGLPGGKVVILRPTNIFGAETLGAWLDTSTRSRIRMAVKGNENAHLVYVKDVAAAASFWLQQSWQNVVETFIVSSDEEAGNTHREVQESLAFLVDTAARPPGMSAPLFVPHCARLIKHGKSNFGDLVYSSRKLHQRGFRPPYGLQAGLKDAVMLLRGRAAAG